MSSNSLLEKSVENIYSLFSVANTNSSAKSCLRSRLQKPLLDVQNLTAFADLALSQPSGLGHLHRQVRKSLSHWMPIPKLFIARIKSLMYMQECRG